jgi:alpha/beta superfamily hydrolase
MMKKTNKPIFFTGLCERAKDYKHFKNFEVIDIDWNDIKLPKINTDVAIGFSFGAIIACEYALKHRVKHLILCSLTPGNDTLKNIKADRITFIAGSKETWIIEDSKRLLKTAKCKVDFKIVLNANHKISGDYKKKLLEIVKNLEQSPQQPKTKPNRVGNR